MAEVMTTSQIAATTAAAAALAGLAYGGWRYASGWPTSHLFGPTLTAPKAPDEFALTFDDGPNPSYTPQLLDLLARYNIRATFFLIGQYAANHRALVRRTQEAGHLIGNHTWTHPNLSLTSSAQTREELHRTSAQLEDITGVAVRYFRPPFGLRRPATLTIARSLNLIPVTWNIIGNDWTPLTTEQIADRVFRLSEKNHRRGNATNLVLHDGSHRAPAMDRSRSITATAMVLERYAQSRRFVTLNAWPDM
jgi:peptidoglycan-N-acetylglucosamine deacetylase